MSTHRPPDFTKDKLILITATLNERYGYAIGAEQAAARIRLNPAIPELSDGLIKKQNLIRLKRPELIKTDCR